VLHDHEMIDAANIFLQGIAAGDTTPEKLNTYLSTVNYKGHREHVQVHLDR
jgi:hypothetical protein